MSGHRSFWSGGFAACGWTMWGTALNKLMDLWGIWGPTSPSYGGVIVSLVWVALMVLIVCVLERRAAKVAGAAT